MNRESLAKRFSGVGMYIAIPGVPVLLLLFLIGIVTEAIMTGVRGEVADFWALLLGAWVTVLFAVIITSIVIHYWIPRLLFIFEERHIAPNLFVFGYTGAPSVPVFVLMLVVAEPPNWLTALGVSAMVAGVGSVVEVWSKYLVTLRRGASGERVSYTGRKQ